MHKLRHIAWLSDIHLDFLDKVRRRAFYQTIIDAEVDGVVISGDICNSSHLTEHLTEMVKAVKVPVWFTLGNHDYYGSTVKATRKKVEALCKKQPLLKWLHKEGVIALSEEIGLIGVDSWADGRAGHYWESNVELADHRLIGDLKGLDAAGRLKVIQRFANEAEEILGRSLDSALTQFKTVFVVSHVPMFYEACLGPDRRVSGPLWMPHYVWHQGGIAIGDVLQNNAHGHVIVLSGHTHSDIRLRIDDRISIWVASAEYDNPVIADVIDLSRYTVKRECQ